MKSKFDYFLVAVCAMMLPFGTGGRIKVFGKGVEYDTEILPFMRGILTESVFVDFSLMIALAVIGGYFLISIFLAKKLSVQRRQQWWYKIHISLNYLLLITPMLLFEEIIRTKPDDQHYLQRFLPKLDDLFGHEYYLLFSLDELGGYVFYYTMILNMILFMMVIYFVFKDHENNGKEELILDDPNMQTLW